MPWYPARLRNLEAARERFGGLADRFGYFLTQTDPLADAVVTAFASDAQRGRRMLATALDHGIDAVSDAPSELRALFARLDHVPSWADFARMDHGARVFQRCGSSAALTLSAYSLMSGYHSAAAVKPLAFTGELDAKAPRRLAETGRYVIETVQVGGMARHGGGFKLGVRVRIMHAQVRRMLLRSGRWDTARWGAPINQADTALTGLEFCSMVLKGTRLLGHRFTHEESEAVMHLWRYAAYVMGVDDELLEEMASEERANRYEALVRFVEDGPDEDSVALARALRGAPLRAARTQLQRLEAHLLGPIHDGLVWAANPEQVARDLQIPHRAFRHAIPIIAALRAPAEAARSRVPALDALATTLGNRALRRRITAALEGSEPSFEPVRAIRELVTARRSVAVA